MHAELLKQEQRFITQKRGEIEVKGKGRQVTYWLVRKEGDNPRIHQSNRCVMIYQVDGRSNVICLL